MNTTKPTTRPMSCLEFRRAKLSDPARLSAEAAAHMRDCALCQAFARGIDATDRQAARALAVPVPEGLAERVILHATGRAPRTAAQTWRTWALAATVVLSTAIGLRWLTQPATPYDLAAMAIAHVEHEPEAFTTLRDADPARFSAVLAEFGADLRAPVGTVRYIRRCPLPEGFGWHIVFETEQGMVTLILVPGHRGGGRDGYEEKDGMVAMAREAGKGHYVIVTHDRRTLESVDSMLKQRINWTAYRADRLPA